MTETNPIPSIPFLYMKPSTTSQIDSRKAKLCIHRKGEAKLVNEHAIYLRIIPRGMKSFPNYYTKYNLYQTKGSLSLH